MPDELTPIELQDWLQRSRAGDAHAEQRLAATLYPALKSIARRNLRPVSHRLSLRATDLAHEAFLRLLDQRTDWQGRAHFLGIAARVTRRVLIELIRERQAEKRGAGVDVVRLEFDADLHAGATDDGGIDWIEMEQTLQQLETRDPIAGRIVELRYFGGLTNEEVADTLAIGVATVVRRWKFARAWLHRRL